MKLIVAFATVLAVAIAAPQGAHPQQQDVVLVKETPLDNIGVDGYNYGYELSDGQVREESAQLINAGTEHEALAVRGSFSYVDPATGQRYTVTYVADDTGFHAQGEHLPA